MNKKIITRFAPSPTGPLHIGGIRTALFAWIYARKHQGEFILRIEDTDLQRSNLSNVKNILNSMTWLGLTPDRSPYYQTNRLDRYKKYIQVLLNQGDAYRCYCSSERLDNLRNKQLKNQQKLAYDNFCRPSCIQSDQDFCSSKPHVIRFKNPSKGMVSWTDLVKGKISIANKELDDFIIQRTNGYPTYNFCSVVDDIEMNITHVIRGDDHVNNTPRQINLYNALLSSVPYFAHVPMITDNNKRKLSKRDSIFDFISYKEAGYLPEAIINYLVRLGWSYGNQELFTIQEILRYFNLEDIQKSPAMFDVNKLNWINQYYIRNLSTCKINQALKYHFSQIGTDILNGPDLEYIVPYAVKRVKNLKELAQNISYFYQDSIDYDKMILSQYSNNSDIQITFEHVQKSLLTLSKHSWCDELILYDTLKQVAQILDLKVNVICKVVRFAITGREHDLSIGFILKWVGNERVLRRIRSFLVLIA